MNGIDSFGVGTTIFSGTQTMENGGAVVKVAPTLPGSTGYNYTVQINHVDDDGVTSIAGYTYTTSCGTAAAQQTVVKPTMAVNSPCTNGDTSDVTVTISNPSQTETLRNAHVIRYAPTPDPDYPGTIEEISADYTLAPGATQVIVFKGVPAGKDYNFDFSGTVAGDDDTPFEITQSFDVDACTEIANPVVVAKETCSSGTDGSVTFSIQNPADASKQDETYNWEFTGSDGSVHNGSMTVPDGGSQDISFSDQQVSVVQLVVTDGMGEQQTIQAVVNVCGPTPTPTPSPTASPTAPAPTPTPTATPSATPTQTAPAPAPAPTNSAFVSAPGLANTGGVGAEALGGIAALGLGAALIMRRRK